MRGYEDSFSQWDDRKPDDSDAVVRDFLRASLLVGEYLANEQ